MKTTALILMAAVLVTACSHTPKKPSGQAFPINTTYQTGR